MKRTELGKELAKLRIENDESSKQMADKLGVSVATLSGYESGRRPVSPEFFEKVKVVYGRDLSSFKTIRRKTIGKIVNLSKFDAQVADLARAVLEGHIQHDGSFDLEAVRKGDVRLMLVSVNYESAPAETPKAEAPAKPVVKPNVPDVPGVDFIDDSDFDGLDEIDEETIGLQA